MRFHLPALPGQPTIVANSSCAYTQKVRRFATMMRDRGHDVFLYGGGGNDARASEYVACYGNAKPIPFDPNAWAHYNGAVIGAMQGRLEPGDDCRARPRPLLGRRHRPPLRSVFLPPGDAGRRRLVRPTPSATGASVARLD